MKLFLILVTVIYMVLETTALPVKDEKNFQLYNVKDLWSNSLMNDYPDNPFVHRAFNERLRQHHKMRNGKKIPFSQSVRPLFNDNPIEILENEMSDAAKINYDSNDFENEIDDGVWRDTKWTN